MQEKEENVIKLFSNYKNTQQNLFVTHNSQLIIEEPEQNLFPDTQRDLIYYLLEKCSDHEHDHRLTLTTHSPYVLYAINNCIMAGIVWDKMREADKEKLKCKLSIINPKDISIYQLNEGEITSIQQEDGLVGNNYFDTKMKELMDDFYIMLNYYR